MLNALHAAVHACQIIHFSVLRQSARRTLSGDHAVSLADESRRNADECRQQAEIAEYWMKMAQDADPGPEAGSDQ